MHAGSEYSHLPGSDYDSISMLEDFRNMKTNPASSIGFRMTPDQEFEIDDYSLRLDRPKLWDRAIRHFAIDEGADLVVVHHPHIIQGLEVYNGKLIAHSLGNFIFDLNYPETYPSMILNSKADESGFTEFMIDPIYIDDYLTVPAKGELGNQILNHIARLSNDLDTYVHVDKDFNKAYVIMDTSSMVVDMIRYNSWTKNSKPIQLSGQSYFQSEPIPLSSAGSLASISDGHPSITHFRIGREKVWMKNFENEGSTLWNINSENEMIQDSIFRRGQNALLHIRSPESPNNIVTNLEDRLPFDNQKQHSLHGYIKTENAKNVSIEARLSMGRTSESLITVSIGDSVSGSFNWKKYWNDIPYTEEAEFFDIRSNSAIPDSGIAYSWFDDVGFIEWDTLKLITEYPISINYPNDYDYIQFYHDQEQTGYFGLELKNAILGPLAPLNANPKVTQNIIFIPDNFYFFDESSGPVGDRNWILDSEEFGFGQTTSLFCNEPGIYEITLRVRGIGDLENEETISVFALEQGSNQHNMGDVNGDGSITSLDALLCVNSILELYTLQPIEFLAADIDGTGSINIYDVLFILDGTN
jgi:PKD repeat protein